MDKYYRLSDLNETSFYQLPRVLFMHPKYKDLSPGAKLAYAILRDRQVLSIKNEWRDDDGRYFLIFTDVELAEIINVSERSVRNYKQELKEKELLESKRIGLGQPNHLYILKTDPWEPAVKNTGQDRTEFPPTPEVNSGQDQQKQPANYTNLSYTDLDKQQQQDAPVNFANVFVQVFGKFPSPMQLEEINGYIDRGMEDGAICFALEKAGKAGSGYLYFLGIIKSWEQNGILTLEAAEEEEAQHQARKAAKHEETKRYSRANKRRDDLYW